MTRLSFAAALVVALLAAPVSGHAQPAPDENKARAHFNQAEMYMKAEVYDKAVDEYLKGYEYAPTAHAFLFNVGLAYQKMDNKQKALQFYERYLEAEPSGSKSPEARARAEALRRALAKSKPTGTVDPLAPGGVDPDPESGIGTGLIEPPGGPEGPGDTKLPPKKSSLGWILAGSALIAAGLAADLLPKSGDNGKFDAADLLPVGLYGVGGVMVIRGVF